MIIIYPMLTSESVNPTLLPGIIKAVEKYIIINNVDEVLKHFNSALGDIVKAGTEAAVKSSVQLAIIGALGWAIAKAKDQIEQFPDLNIPGLPKLRKVGKKLVIKEGSKTKGDDTQDIYLKGLDKVGDIASDSVNDAAKKSKIQNISMPKYDTVSLEPTWVQVETSDGLRLVGVKVIAYKVKSTTGMVGLLMNDSQLKKMVLLTTKMSRTVARVFYRAMRGIKIPGFSGKTITGDIKKDIVLAQSMYGQNAFVCFSKLDIEQDDIFSTPEAVQKLYKLGWTSLIVTDDVNKQATFCMKQFGGMCSTIPYSFIFSSLGKEHSEVYKDLEDAARSAGPFFRKTTTKRKVFLK